MPQEISTKELIEKHRSLTQPQSVRDDFSSFSTKDLINFHRQSIVEKINDEPSLGQKAIKAVVDFGRAVDSITGAPTRAAIRTLQKGGGLLESVRSFGTQFAEAPEKAPSGQEIVEAAGVPRDTKIKLPLGLTLSPGFRDRESQIMRRVAEPGKKFTEIEVSPSRVLGLAVDVVGDVSNFIPVVGTAKLAAKGLGKTASLAAKGVGKGAEFAVRTVAGEVPITVAKNTAEGIKTAFNNLFNPKVADDFTALKQVAEKNGIDVNILPESVEFGERSIISRAVRQQRESVLGEAALNKFEDGLRAVRESVDKKIINISGGVPLNEAEAGAYIRKAYDASLDDLLGGMDDTYRTVSESLPGLMLSAKEKVKLKNTLESLTSFAKKRLRLGVSSQQKSQAKQLLGAIESVKNTKGRFSQTIDVLMNVGDAAFKKSNTLALDPPDVVKLRGLYGSLRNSVIGTIRDSVEGGKALAKRLEDNNLIIHKFIEESSPLDRILGNKNLSDETVFRSLVLSGDSKKIQSLRDVLNPDDMAIIKGAALNSIIKRGDDFSFSFRQVRNSLRNKSNVFRELLDDTEATEFLELVNLGDKFGPAVLSSSGTSAGNAFRELLKATNQGVTNEAFIEALKTRARKGLVLSPKTIPQSMIPQRTPLDIVLKVSQVGSRLDFERNERDAMRRRMNP